MIILGEPNWETTTHDLFRNYAVQLVPSILLYYDYFLTLDEEIAYFWPIRRSLSWSSALFLTTRYLALLTSSTIFISMMTGNATAGCGKIQDFHDIFEIFLQIPVGCLCTMRVYALYSQDRRVLVGLIIAGVALLIVATYLVSTANLQNPVIFWSAAPFCATIRTERDATRLAVAWGAVLLYDVIIFCLTALRAFQVWNAGAVVQIVLRDGVVYFCALAGVNVFNIGNFLAAPPLLKPTFASLTNVMSVTFICRLMLNLCSTPGPDPSVTEDMELQETRVDLDTIITSPDVEVTRHYMTTVLDPEALAPSTSISGSGSQSGTT